MATDERIQVSIRLPRPLYRRIRIAAAQHEVSINAYLTQLLDSTHPVHAEAAGQPSAEPDIAYATL